MAEPSFQLSQRWGARGKDILEAGKGGGFVALPYMLDDYEKALGLEPLEMWLLKRLLRNYWNADDIFPSFRKIARQAKISVPTLRKIRRQLEAKGFIQMTGRKGTTKGAPDNRLTIDMRPLFFALWICILCDPQSKLAKRQRHAQIREELTETLGNDVDLYSWYVGKHVVKDLPLPLDVKIAKAAADKAGITLDWETISQMQGQAAQAIQKDDERYKRLMLIRASVKTAAEEAFKVNWNFAKAFDLLKWLDERVTSDEVYAITKEYTQNLRNTNKTHRFRDFDRFMRAGVEAPKALRCANSFSHDEKQCLPT